MSSNKKNWWGIGCKFLRLAYVLIQILHVGSFYTLEDVGEGSKNLIVGHTGIHHAFYINFK